MLASRERQLDAVEAAGAFLNAPFSRPLAAVVSVGFETVVA